MKCIGEEESLMVSTALWFKPGIPRAQVFTILSRITHGWMTSYFVVSIKRYCFLFFLKVMASSKSIKRLVLL